MIVSLLFNVYWEFDSHALDRLEYYEYRDKDKENPICKARQSFDTSIAKWVLDKDHNYNKSSS